MTLTVPPPVPLPMPPGDPDALAALAQGVAGAAYRLADLADRLRGPAASAPGWFGADATAAAEQVGALTALTRDVTDALMSAVGRLSAHEQLLHAARRRVAALRTEQDEDIAVAFRRLAHLEGAVTDLGIEVPQARAVLDELAAAECARRRAHEGLLTAVADDAAATASALDGATRAVGGTGVAGDGGRVLAHVAALLPGWGQGELARRGSALAHELRARPGWDAPAERAMVFTGSVAFARALLTGLGREGMRDLLLALGSGRAEPGSALARLLARSFRTADPTGDGDPLDDVLRATYVEETDPGQEPDRIALGMAAVLSASSGARAGGVRVETALDWGRQILAREHRWGRAVDRALPVSLGVATIDPVPIVSALIADAGAADAAAALLDGPEAWTTLLSRRWDDGAQSLGRLIGCVVAANGPAGDTAVRAGLQVLGAGLAGGDPDGWPVNRTTVATIAPSLGAALAAHVPVATEALWPGAGGRGLDDPDAALRGLGYLTIDPQAATAIEQALHRWAQVQPVALPGGSPAGLLPSVAVPSAYLAAREYGQRLAHALRGFEQQQIAENAARGWNVTVGLGVNLLPGRGGVLGGVLAGYAAILLGCDGTWENGVDRGLRFDREDAAGLALGSPPQLIDRQVVAAQARTVFDRTAAALGTPRPPASPDHDWLAPALDALPGLRGDALRVPFERGIGDLYDRAVGGPHPRPRAPG